MKKHRRLSRQLSLLMLAMALTATGCLPIPHRVALSPPILGQLQRSDGTPLAGAQVILSDASRDSTCAKVAASTTTDIEGRLALPATTRRRSILLVAPHTPAGSCFRVCVGSADALTCAYEQFIYPKLGRHRGPAYSLRCVQAQASQDSTHVTCARGSSR